MYLTILDSPDRVYSMEEEHLRLAFEDITASIFFFVIVVEFQWSIDLIVIKTC
jgi:hypothetical protein